MLQRKLFKIKNCKHVIPNNHHAMEKIERNKLIWQAFLFGIHIYHINLFLGDINPKYF